MVNLDDYFDEEKLKEKQTLVKVKKKAVYREEIDGEIYFIKKYIPIGRRAVTTNLYLKKDFAKHYKDVSDAMKKIGIPHIEPEKIQIRKKGFFKRESIVVTKYGGEVFQEELKKMDFELQKRMLEIYYSYYMKLFKNGIYVTDYNFSGALLDSNGNLRLIDFDAYKVGKKLTNHLKKRVHHELIKGNNMRKLDGFSEELMDYNEERIKSIIEELNLI